MRSRAFRHCFAQSASTLFLLLSWEAGVHLGFLNGAFFPAPSAVFFRLFELFTVNADFSRQIGFSLYRLLLGALISIPLAVAVGFAIELSDAVGAVFRPLIGLLYPIPKLVLLPLFLLVFGLGDASKVAMIALGVFFFVLLSTMEGVRRLRSLGFMDLVWVFRIPLIKRLYYVIFRGVIIEILSGIKMGLGYGLVMVVAGEFTACQDGIGVFIWNSWDQFRIRDLYAGLVVVSAFGFIIFYGIDKIRSAIRWIPADSASFH